MISAVVQHPGRGEDCPKVEFHRYLLDLPDDLELIGYEVRGNCMQAAGIIDRDLIFTEVREPVSGDIVVAVVDGRPMLKRYLVENGIAFVRPDDGSCPDIVPQKELIIWGVVVAMMRTFR